VASATCLLTWSLSDTTPEESAATTSVRNPGGAAKIPLLGL